MSAGSPSRRRVRPVEAQEEGAQVKHIAYYFLGCLMVWLGAFIFKFGADSCAIGCIAAVLYMVWIERKERK